MKKFIIILIILLLLFGGLYFGYPYFMKKQEKGIPRVITEEEVANIDNYYIYGNHLNIKGSLTIEDINYKDIALVLYNGNYQEINLEHSNQDNTINFYITNLINDGLYLDDIKYSDYYLFIRLAYDNTDYNPDSKNKPQDEIIYKYYTLNNITEYKTTEYYQLSPTRDKIFINSDNDYNTMMFTMSHNNDSNIYDIVIDAGHGGMDGGGAANGYKETDFTIDLATSIKEKLEEYGLKVKLTWEKGSLGPNDLLEEYGEHGRAVISSEVKAKYVFSIHINKNTANYVHGLEIYTPNNINYDLAKSLAESITSMTGLEYSNNRTYKMFNGVYTHNFSESEVANNLADYERRGISAYNVTTNSNYLYMIRETGGFMTGAYVDDRNSPKILGNAYYNSNIGSEAYLLELGYLSNQSDLQNLINKQELYVEAIVKSIKNELKITESTENSNSEE